MINFSGKKINKSISQKLLATGFYAGFTLLTVAVVSGCAMNPVSVASKPGTTFGKIYVDTPEVYSRERLVNDRFQQDAWLREKLREKPVHGVQGGTESTSRTSTEVSLAAGTEAPSAPQIPESTSGTPPQEAVKKPGKPGKVEDTPIEQFRDAMAYREEVRNEILENQLDDRHDIAGSTLYRLKFDATVVPLRDTSAYAMVEVTVRGPSIWNITEDDEKGRQPPSLEIKRKEKGQKSRDIQISGNEATRKIFVEAQLARYVAGLDDETLDLYSIAYANWLGDIDLDKYSAEDMDYGPLSDYFEYLDYGSESEEQTEIIPGMSEIVWFSSIAERDAVQDELIALGIPSSYHMVGGEVGGDLLLAVNTGLANFISDMRDHNTAIYTYAVTPKERVQRVYENSLAAGTVGVSVGAEQGALGASLGHSNSREARANAIMRQPQVVGYSPNAHQSGEATLGWLIGPRYKVSSDPNGPVSFRHVPTQHTLTGIVSVPSWWNELTLETRTYWLDENGVEYTEKGEEIIPGTDMAKGQEARVSLPSDWTSIVNILDPQSREPKLEDTATGTKELRACEYGSVVIRGSQLWRSTVVTLGGQQADQISVLPNMKGIIASFYWVEPSISGKEDLYLWTSEGEVLVGNIEIIGECIYYY
jgi:hypothetical protein